ncbi:MAG: ABC transporter permease [Bacteroidales bacterium]
MKIFTIALNTMREIIRDKVFYTILALGSIAILGIKLITPLTLGEEVRLIRDFGLSMISMMGILITILISTRMVYDEIQRKTIYTIIPKSLKRWEFIIGKYMGFVLAIVIVVLALGMVFIGYMLILGLAFNTNILLAIVFQLMELLLVSAIAILFSTFTSPVGSGIFTFAIYFIGHFTADILVLGELTKSEMIKKVSSFIYYILPNLSYFNIRSEVVHNLPIDLHFVLFSVVYGLAYTIILLTISVLFFEKKDL